MFIKKIPACISHMQTGKPGKSQNCYGIMLSKMMAFVNMGSEIYGNR